MTSVLGLAASVSVGLIAMIVALGTIQGSFGSPGVATSSATLSNSIASGSNDLAAELGVNP